MSTILVALDGSPRAPSVLAGALSLAQATGARLLLLRVVSIPVDIPPEVVMLRPDQVEAFLVRAAQAELEQLAQEVPPGLLAGVRAEPGVPWQKICDVAQAEDAHMIVIGAHGYHLIDRILGTTAAKVINHADRTVLVVRPSPDEAALERAA